MPINCVSTSMGTQVYQSLMSIFLFSYEMGIRQIPSTKQGGALPLFVFFYNLISRCHSCLFL